MLSSRFSSASTTGTSRCATPKSILPMGKSIAERAIRLFNIGRKNLFSNTPEGSKARSPVRGCTATLSDRTKQFRLKSTKCCCRIAARRKYHRSHKILSRIRFYGATSKRFRTRGTEALLLVGLARAFSNFLTVPSRYFKLIK